MENAISNCSLQDPSQKRQYRRGLKDGFNSILYDMPLNRNDYHKWFPSGDIICGFLEDGYEKGFYEAQDILRNIYKEPESYEELIKLKQYVSNSK